MTSSNRPTCCNAGAELIRRRNADTFNRLDRPYGSINVDQGTHPDPAHDNQSICPYHGTRLLEHTPSPAPEDKRPLVIDLGCGLVHGVETNIHELQGVKVLVLGDQKDSEGDRDEIVIDGTDRIVYQTERVVISDCTRLLKSLAQLESGKVEGHA